MKLEPEKVLVRKKNITKQELKTILSKKYSFETDPKLEQLSGVSFTVYKIVNDVKTLAEVAVSCKNVTHLDKKSVLKLIRMLLETGIISYSQRYEEYLQAIKSGHDLDKPIEIDFEPTYRCNLQCKMCEAKNLRDDKINNFYEKYSFLGGTFPEWQDCYLDRNELAFEEIKSLFFEFSNFGVKSIAFSGGEPLLRPDFFEMLVLATDLKMTGSVTTNGVYLTEEISRYAMSNGWEICFSVDGVDAATHDSIRGVKGTFDKAIKNIKIALKQRETFDSGKVAMRCTLQKDNVSQINQYIDFGNELGVDSVHFNLLVGEDLPGLVDSQFFEQLYHQVKQAYDRNITNPFDWGHLLINSELRKDDIIALKPYERLFRTKSLPCYKCADVVVINPFGDVFPCCIASGPDFVMGNIRQRPFRKIWNGQFFKNFRKNLVSIDPNNKNNQICRYCDMYPDIEQIHNRICKNG